MDVKKEDMDDRVIERSDVRAVTWMPSTVRNSLQFNDTSSKQLQHSTLNQGFEHLDTLRQQYASMMSKKIWCW